MEKLLPAGHTMDIIVPDLPLFNQDLEIPDKYPANVKDFRNRLKAADCFLFGLSEYNFSISGMYRTSLPCFNIITYLIKLWLFFLSPTFLLGPAKNAIDWGSRGPDGGNLFNDKAAAVVSSGGGVGGMSGFGGAPTGGAAVPYKPLVEQPNLI